MQDRGRIQWTGDASQGKLSFVIYDVRRSDDLLYRIRLRLVIPENDSVTVVHRKSYLRVKVAEKASYKGLTSKTARSAPFGESVNFKWNFQNNDSASLKNLTAIRASLAIWKQEDQRFVELFVAQAENKTNFHPFQNDEHLAHEERITWVGNLRDLLFSFIMTNVSFEDEREYYLVICFEEYLEPSKAILVFTSTYLEVPGSMVLTGMPTSETRNSESDRGSPSLKVTVGMTKKSDKDDSTNLKKATKIALISAVTSAIVIIIIIITFYCKIWKPKDQQGRKRRGKPKEVVVTYKSPQEEVRMFRAIKCTGNDNSKSTDSNSLKETEPAPPLSPRALRSHSWEFPKQRLQVREVFGQGAFGQVVKGLAFEIAGNVGWTMVAIKMLKEHASESDRHDLLSELSIMKKLPPHRHVVRLLGCVTTSANLLVIVEFACHGDLLGYLLKSRGLPDTYYKTTGKLTRVTAKKMIMFAWQIADGMNFLAENKVIHRDLAARNVLVAAGNVCKITDFGLAREVHENDMYTMTAGGRVPAKWTAYEALLYGVFTTQSDVWSYGVVMYEIFTLGGEPYAGIKTRDVVYLLGKGFRMRRPKHVDKELHAVISSCWNEDPLKRPTFKALQETLEKLERQQTGYINLQSFTDATYVNVDNAVRDKVRDEAIF